MNSAPHLLIEDRPEFERVLDRALGTPPPVPDGRDGRLTAGQLRTMALAASTAISACAADEYAHYLRVREAQRAARNAPAAGDPAAGTPRDGVAGAVSGAGLGPVLTVLTTVLAGVAALVFLVSGYALSAVHPSAGAAAPLRDAGWTFLAIAGAGLLLCIVGMVRTAVRDGSSAIRATAPDEAPGEVAVAREAWSAALLERGILPFLRDARAAAADRAPADRPERDGERPARPSRLGYTRPGFSSPGDGPRADGPRFSSPDFSSPDFFSPDFTGPHGETGPDAGTGH